MAQELSDAIKSDLDSLELGEHRSRLESLLLSLGEADQPLIIAAARTDCRRVIEKGDTYIVRIQSGEKVNVVMVDDFFEFIVQREAVEKRSLTRLLSELFQRVMNAIGRVPNWEDIRNFLISNDISEKNGVRKRYEKHISTFLAEKGLIPSKMALDKEEVFSSNPVLNQMVNMAAINQKMKHNARVLSSCWTTLKSENKKMKDAPDNMPLTNRELLIRYKYRYLYPMGDSRNVVHWFYQGVRSYLVDIGLEDELRFIDGVQ